MGWNLLQRLALVPWAGVPAVQAAQPLQHPLRLTDPGHQALAETARQHLDFSSPAPHLFASTATLLQQWANTVFPNGHNLAAVQIPPLTLFFHGRLDAETPPSPEWLAFDQEMSWGIMGGTRSSFLLTYQTTRPVKALYFDGESATLMGLGQLDTQMLQLWGNVSGPESPVFRGLWPEYERARGLCDWLTEAKLRGPGWGFEAVVRMNAGFEMIWCDFNSPSLRLLTHLNVTAPQLPSEDDEGGSSGLENDDEVVGAQLLQRRPPIETSYYSLPPVPTRTDRAADPSQPPAPPNWRRDRNLEPFLESQTWGWFDSATWHYGSSRNGPGLGETRARVLGCGVLSYYSPQFANQTLNRAIAERAALNLTSDGLWKGEGRDGNRTMALRQLARRRRYHHLGEVTPEEAALMRENSERALRTLLEPYNDCSGADWTQMSTEIIQRTTLQMKMLESKLSSFPEDEENKTALRSWLFDLRSHSHLSIVTYLEYPARVDLMTWTIGGRVFNETFARCRYRYTRLLAPEEKVRLVPEEEDLKWAVEEVQKAICFALVTVGFGIEATWHQLFGKASSQNNNHGRGSGEHDLSAVKTRVSTWSDAVAELTAWLGWESELIGCDRVCAWDERCFIPMWPLLARPNFGRRPPGNSTGPPWRRPGGRYPPYYRPPGFRPNGTSPGGPRPGMPGRSPAWMGDETDLWEPRCVKVDYITGGR